ncbi:MAG: relaxase/mobilization nuclease domain-containing protein [Cyclobacteriaceae bacterium]|nr:relaxase/mobilization nuclease domain-containing protein [Cyclobacteriaceae bacterium]
MVAKVISGKSIQGALNYNENKVEEGKASCMLAHKFGGEACDLSFSNKLIRFQKLIGRNPKVKTNALHISLNFDVTEKLEVRKLKAIAQTYMERIGFGEQPYLVYQHTDAAHPHIHIVSTLIRSNGKRIDIHNLGRNQSEKARKEIETEFNLVQAESKSKKKPELQPIEASKAIYGKSETKRTISNTVRWITQRYKYTSLPELNAALRQFNVIANRGSEETQMFKKKGLHYSLLDEDGNKVGIPIKASAIYGKPTLVWLEKQFKLNEALRQPYKDSLKKSIDRILKTPSPPERAGVRRDEAFKKSLAANNIFALFRQNEAGIIYGITFVDNTNKVVFNGSDLGKDYSAKAILERINASSPTGSGGETTSGSDSQNEFEASDSLGIGEVIADLTEAKQFDYSLPDALKRKRKKKKRKGFSQ